MNINKLNTTRFSDRVSDYIKYRPSYPAEIIEKLSAITGLNKDFVIADIVPCNLMILFCLAIILIICF